MSALNVKAKRGLSFLLLLHLLGCVSNDGVVDPSGIKSGTEDEPVLMNSAQSETEVVAEVDHWDVWSVDPNWNYQICREYIQGYLDNKPPKTVGVCGIPLPFGESNFKLPVWTSVNPLEHEEIIAEMYFWKDLFSHKARKDCSSKENCAIDKAIWKLTLDADSPIDDFLWNDLWLSRRDAVMSQIESQEMIMQVAHIDMDFDGDLERVYRLQVGGCNNVGLSGAQMRSAYFVPKEDSLAAYNYISRRRHGLAGASDLVYWRGRISIAEGNSLLEPKMLSNGDGLISPQVCRIRPF